MEPAYMSDYKMAEYEEFWNSEIVTGRHDEENIAEKVINEVIRHAINEKKNLSFYPS